MKKKIYVLMIALILTLVIVGTSYSYLRVEKETNNTSITLDTLDVIILNDIPAITMNNAYPMLDAQGLQNDKISFKIQNIETIDASYKVSLVDKEVVSTMLNKDIKYQLKRTNETTNVSEVLPIKNLDDTGVIDSGIIKTGEIISYDLIMWIDYNANPNGLKFAKVIQVDGMQIPNLDSSGANFPEMLDNMIPVYYDKVSDTEGVWRVADIKNLNKDYQWFDYNNYMWANAVTVHKDVMDSYYGYSGEEIIRESNVSVNIETNEEISEEVNFYTSGGKNVNSANSVATFNFTTSDVGKLSFDYSVSSESCCDKLTITLNDGSTTTNVVSSIGGEVTSSKEVDLKANTNYTLTATYKKDGSVNTGDDQATLSKINITAPLSSELTYTEAATQPWTSSVQTMVVKPAYKPLTSQTYTYDSTTGVFTLENATEMVYTNAHEGYFTCNSTEKTTCYKLYEIKSVTNNTVTSVDIHSGSNKGALGSVLGQEVKMEDITTMWVWIPRYKYVIWAGNNNPSEEQLINVEFEHGIDKTGTVSCDDNILTSSDSNTSQTCTDTKNGSIINYKSTYTHPAFTFGDDELTGFWMAKFEMSTDDENSVCTSTSVTLNCNINDLNVIVKPDTLSLRYQTVSNQFATIRKMEVYDNIHGFSQDSIVTSHLDSNGYLTGDIKNDSNNFDTHMIKNMEWGAVAYLSYSKYGKWSNPLYTGDYRRVYKNNYYSSSGYIFRTGCSSGTYNGSNTINSSSTFLYNDMTIKAEGQGYRGAGASTTGTVYGIYDMSGGAYDYVMGNMVNSSGNFYPYNAGTWATAQTGNIPNEKYYDKYSYNSSSNYSANSQMRGKLGDATREATTTFGVNTGGWGGVYRYMPYSSLSWLSRGGSAHSASYWGVMYSDLNNGGGSNYASSRPSLVVSREFPWLSK